MHRINLVYLLTMLHLRSIKLERTIPQTFHCHDIGGKCSYRPANFPRTIVESTATSCKSASVLKYKRFL